MSEQAQIIANALACEAEQVLAEAQNATPEQARDLIARFLESVEFKPMVNVRNNGNVALAQHPAVLAEVANAGDVKGHKFHGNQYRATDDPSTLQPHEMLPMSEWDRIRRTPYFDESGHRVASSRTTPSPEHGLKPGIWRVDDQFRGIHGREISQLRELDPHELILSEHLVEENIEGRGNDARRYAEWLKEGRQMPPIEVVSTDPEDKLKVADGHRRVEAAKLAGKKVLAWVSPNTDHPEGARHAGYGNNPVIRVAHTYELATGKPFVPSANSRFTEANFSHPLNGQPPFQPQGMKDLVEERHGMRFVIENAKGSTRYGTHNGEPWEVVMPADYGYVCAMANAGDVVGHEFHGNQWTKHFVIDNPFGKENAKEFAIRHGLKIVNGRFIKLYHATPHTNTFSELREGSYLEKDPEKAAHFAARDRGLKRHQIKVHEVLLQPDELGYSGHYMALKPIPLNRSAANEALVQNGADGDGVDCWLGEHPNDQVHIIDQCDLESGEFDEHKCFVDFPNRDAVIDTYCRAYADGKGSERIMGVKTMGMDAFKAWLQSAKTKKQFANAHIRAYTKQVGGKTVRVREHDDKRPFHSGATEWTDPETGHRWAKIDDETKIREIAGPIYKGERVEVKADVSKHESGTVTGERVLAAFMRKKHGYELWERRGGSTTPPVDRILVGKDDVVLAEMKTGVISAPPQWRVTHGGKHGADIMAKFDEARKKDLQLQRSGGKKRFLRELNLKMQLDAMQRKRDFVKRFKKLYPKTTLQEITGIVNHDTKKMDIHVFDGVHRGINWKTDLARKGYVATIQYA